MGKFFKNVVHASTFGVFRKPGTPATTDQEKELERRQRTELDELTREENERLKAIKRQARGRRMLLGSFINATTATARAGGTRGGGGVGRRGGGPGVPTGGAGGGGSILEGVAAARDSSAGSPRHRRTRPIDRLLLRP